MQVLAAWLSLPGRPSWNGSLTIPWSFSTLCIAASSITAPAIAIFRDGPASSTGVNLIVIPPPAAIGRDGRARRDGDPQALPGQGFVQDNTDTTPDMRDTVISPDHDRVTAFGQLALTPRRALLMVSSATYDLLDPGEPGGLLPRRGDQPASRRSGSPAW
jgi:hypothetical protein